MSTSQREILAERMQDPDYRAAFIDQYIRRFLPAQIRAMREERGWNQAELGSRCGKSQEWISRLESPNYGRYSTQTLIDLASGFDVALMVKFVSFGSFLDWYTSRTSHGGVPSFENDLGVERSPVGQASHLRLIAGGQSVSVEAQVDDVQPGGASTFTTKQGHIVAA